MIISHLCRFSLLTPLNQLGQITEGGVLSSSRYINMQRVCQVRETKLLMTNRKSVLDLHIFRNTNGTSPSAFMMNSAQSRHNVYILSTLEGRLSSRSIQALYYSASENRLQPIITTSITRNKQHVLNSRQNLFVVIELFYIFYQNQI